MGFSYSKVNTFDDCPYKFKLRYIDKLEPVPDLDPNNALFLGTAVHEGIEKRSIDAALESYKQHYSEITKQHEIAMFKLSAILKKAIEQVPEGEYEYKLLADDGFIGFIDCLVKVGENEYDLLDFKYSNNVSGYSNSGQVHVYKYYFEKLTGNKVRNLYYVMIPKCTSALNESASEEKEEHLKESILKHAEQHDVTLVPIEYNRNQVGWFFGKKHKMEHATEFEKRYSTKCSWCEYQKYCSSNGKDTSNLIIKESTNAESDGAGKVN